MIREITTEEISCLVAKLSREANTVLTSDLISALEKAYHDEISPVGRTCLQGLIENAELARTEGMPVCQDTGMAVVFVDHGREAVLTGNLTTAINEGIRRGYREGYFRKSVVKDPLERLNTGDNTPAVIHLRMVPGNKVRITVAPKGFGSENMSRLAMLTPAEGIDGVKRFVVDTVSRAGANPCPPVLVGVGIGGTMEKAALMAKQALLRSVGSVNIDPELSGLEAELLSAINRLGIGPQGLGGSMTALAVHVETYPTHIAGLPVAVNLSCHVTRHRAGVI